MTCLKHQISFAMDHLLSIIIFLSTFVQKIVTLPQPEILVFTFDPDIRSDNYNDHLVKVNAKPNGDYSQVFSLILFRKNPLLPST
jgi:hypothetical protein